uniref:Chromosome 18 open reading frame 63 n=1 Tax=Anolis carolinensis TaxID=28377 RepID=G1KC70_ANOCA
MGDARCQSLFFISLPELQNLCAVKVTVSSQLDATGVRASQRKLCRQLVLLHQEVIVSPILGTLNEISVIMPVSMAMAVPERVIPAIFQTCLSYTLIAKLAPKWNQAGHLLIQETDILDIMDFISVMDINVLETQLCISVEVSTIRLPPAKLEDFDISTNIIKKFDSDGSAVIQSCSILSNWCYVLPSMKMGQIINISHFIPSDSPFQSYNELQLHWKNLYGYSLPKDSQKYCNIYFKFIGEQLFTYPMSCIRSQPVQYFPRINLDGVLDAFITDVKTIIHTCGFPLKMTNKALYATKELTQASAQEINSKPANLTEKRNCKLTLTQGISPKCMFSPLTCTIENSHKMELEAKLPNTGIFSNLNLLRKDANPGGVERKVFSKEEWKTSKESASMLNSEDSFRISNRFTSENTTKIIPIFKGKLLQMDRQTANAINGKKKQNISQYSAKVMKVSTAAKSAVFKSSQVQLDKLLQDTSLSNIAHRSVVQIQNGKNNVKSAKPNLIEKNENGVLLSNGASTNRIIGGNNSSTIKPKRLNPSLTSTSYQSAHPAPAVQQHLNKPADLSIGNNALTNCSQKTHLYVARSNVDETKSTITWSQTQSSAEEAKLNVCRSNSSVRKRAKKSGEKKEMVRSQKALTLLLIFLIFNSILKLVYF